MKRLAAAMVAATVSLGGTAPVCAQSMSGMNMDMPGMKMPAPAKKTKPHPKRKTAKAAAGPTARPAAAAATPMPTMNGMDHVQMQGGDHAAMPGMNMSGGSEAAAQPAESMPGMQMPAVRQSGHDMQDMAGMAMDGAAQTGTALPAGNAPPPPAPTDHAADRVYGAGAMADGRREFQMMHGGAAFSQVLVNLAEYQVKKGGDGYRWDGEAWFGGDINRLVLKSEGEGAVREGLDTAEAQTLYSRAIGPYFNLQGGVRQDFSPRARTYLTVGTEGLAPSFFEVQGALFLSTQGELLARTEGYYDFRITQRLMLQPRVELNLAAQDTRETRTGAGLSQAELGLRLRYEIRREFAPYIGISYERRFGHTADFARAAGEDTHGTSFVFGVRTWF